MKKKLLNRNVGSKAAMVHRIIVAAVFFAVFINIVNLGAFYKGSAADLLNALPLQAQSSALSRVFNAINLPVKIVSGLFEFNNNFGNEKKTQDKKKANDNYAVIYGSVSRTGAELIKRDAYFPVSELKTFDMEPVDTGPNISLLNLFIFNNFIMILLLNLMLISVLPRGISAKNDKKYIFARPVFI